MPIRFHLPWRSALFIMVLVLGVWITGPRAAFAGFDRFEGAYAGTAEVFAEDGARETRDMSVTITAQDVGFRVAWVTVIRSADGRSREKSYQIDFVESTREGVYGAAMTRDLFGHAAPLDPLKGEPYVWARITGETLTVFSLFVDASGDYEVQQFDRSLAEGGLELVFHTTRNGMRGSAVETFLARQ